MKLKCPTCGTGKARRRCARQGNAEICSVCCASIRDADCGDCIHYASAREYESNRRISSELSNGHFFAEINPEVQDAVNTAMEIALRGDTRKAMATLNGLLREHPHNHDLCYGIGTLHAIQGESEEAIRWLDRAIQILPYSVESHFNKGVAYQKQLDVANAVRSFQKVVEVGGAGEPEVIQARSIIDHMAAVILENEGTDLDTYLQSSDKFNQAFEQMERGDWQGALNGFRASAAIHDRNAPCHGNMGLCQAHLGHKAMALAELDRALELNPDYEPAHNNRKLVAVMEEGRPLANTVYKSINYAMENVKKMRE